MRSKEDVQSEINFRVRMFRTKLLPSQVSSFEEILFLYDELQNSKGRSYKTEVENLLGNLKLSPNLNGYIYISEAVTYMLENEVKRMKCTEMYAILSKKFSIPKSTIESNIKSAIEKIFMSKNYELINRIFSSYSSEKGIVGNTKFINNIARYIREQEEVCIT